MLKKKKSKKGSEGQSTRELMGIKDITEYSIATKLGDIVFFIIKPTRLRRDEEVRLSVLHRICQTLDVNIGEVMEFLPESE